MTFDGEHIWVLSYLAAQVVKVRASDMTVWSSYSTSLDSFPTTIAYDGANVWVASGNNRINKIRASDGAILANITGYFGHSHMTFDGEHIWVNNSAHNSISKIRARDAALLGPYMVGQSPRGLAFDGANIWVANFDGDTVSKVRASDGTVLGAYPVGDGPLSVVFDGRHIWVSNSLGGTLTKLRAADGYNASATNVATPGEMVFDGYSIWVLSGSNPASLVRVRAYDGAVTGTYAALTSPTDIAFDGENLWVSHISSNRLVKQ
jgi:DNA-binding beta-propeller fold protein YncE